MTEESLERINAPSPEQSQIQAHHKWTSNELAWLIRRHGIEMTHLSGGSHIGAILSVADIVAVLYSGILYVDPNQPDMAERDRFILSKGHAGAAIYAALAECGFFPIEELRTHYQNGSRLSGHVSHRVPGVDFSTGSLGHGLSVGAGMALAAKTAGLSHRVFVVLGDGECDEGSVWEAALFAAHYRLANLTVIVDHNRMQSLDFCEKTLALGNLADKWSAFGWHAVTVDGHDHAALQEALTASSCGRPRAVVAKTVKGYGVDFMQNDVLWHYRFPHDGWEYEQAVSQLHAIRPPRVRDPWTPQGIPHPQPIPNDADIFQDHTLSATWHPDWQG